jgi:hypothetical protein
MYRRCWKGSGRMNWSLAFEPFRLADIGGNVRLLVFGIAGILLRQRGAWLRLAAFAALALALLTRCCWTKIASR